MRLILISLRWLSIIVYIVAIMAEPELYAVLVVPGTFIYRYWLTYFLPLVFGQRGVPTSEHKHNSAG